MMGKEEKTPCTSTICCGVIIINFIVLRCIVCENCNSCNNTPQFRAELPGSKEREKKNIISYKWDPVLAWETAATG